MTKRIAAAFVLSTALAAGTLIAQSNLYAQSQPYPQGNPYAQNQPNAYATEPEYLNTFYALTPHGNLIDLEYRTVAFHPRAWSVPGYASFKTVADFKPGQSPIRLPANAQFVVRGNVNVNPAMMYELRRLKGNSSHREFVMSAAHGSIVGGNMNPEEGVVPVRFQDYGQSSFRIIPDQPLAPGEYALAVRGRYAQLFCFGVDGAAKQ